MARKRKATVTPQAYARYRALGLPAHSAFQAAQAEAKRPALEWRNGRASFKRGKFTVHARMTPDDFADMSWLGEFSDTPGDGAIARFAPDSYRASGFRSELRYFNPSYTVAQRRKDLRANGYSRGVSDYLARKQAHKDMARAEEYQEWCLTVTVYANGIELASDSLGGIDGDSEDYATDCVFEMLPQVIEQAKDALADLAKLARK